MSDLPANGAHRAWLEAKYSDRIKFTYLDIDDSTNQQAMRDLGYIGRPHFYLLDAKGNIISQWLGYIPAEDFETAFAQVIE